MESDTYATAKQCMKAITEQEIHAFIAIVNECPHALEKHIKQRLKGKEIIIYFKEQNRQTSKFEVLWLSVHGISGFGVSYLEFKIGGDWDSERAYIINKAIWLTIIKFSSA